MPDHAPLNRLLEQLRAGRLRPRHSAAVLTRCARQGRDALYWDQAELTRYTGLLRQHLELYAQLGSPIYAEPTLPITKSRLRQLQRWQVPGLAGILRCSSSSTSWPLQYLVRQPLASWLEQHCHYGELLHEFGLDPRGLRVVHLSGGDKGWGYRSGQLRGLHYRYATQGSGPAWRHGGDGTRILHLQYPGQCWRHPLRYVQLLLQLLEGGVDVLCLSGELARLVLRGAELLGVRGRLTRLLSVTAGGAEPADLQRWQQLGYCEWWCDHMRCWDGGATFLTCRYQVRHLQEQLAGVECVAGRLVSTDYFNLVCPFLRYDNGDQCWLQPDYRRCQCGRLYRPFRLQPAQPWPAKGRYLDRLRLPELERRWRWLTTPWY